MGWKNVKQAYRIEHFVQVREGRICIGSSYIPDLIVIDMEGEIQEVRNFNDEDLIRYMNEFRADPIALKDAVASADEFSQSITVYTYDGDAIIEKQCEVVGWPNVTHDGEMMFDNTFFTDRKQAIESALDNAKAGMKLLRNSIEREERKLKELESELVEAAGEVVNLQTQLDSLSSTTE